MKSCHGVCVNFAYKTVRHVLARSLNAKTQAEGYRKCNICKVLVKQTVCECCKTRTSSRYAHKSRFLNSKE